jgi:hypothetical protein
MNQKLKTELGTQVWERTADSEGTLLRASASATLVNRTHRIVRERALTMQNRKSKVRGLLLPLMVSGALLFTVVCAAWIMLDEYDVAPVGLPDASNQIFVMMLWCLPISTIALAVVAFRRSGQTTDPGGRR